MVIGEDNGSLSFFDFSLSYSSRFYKQIFVAYANTCQMQCFQMRAAYKQSGHFMNTPVNIAYHLTFWSYLQSRKYLLLEQS